MRKILILVALLPLFSACAPIRGFTNNHVGPVFSPREVLVLRDNTQNTGGSSSSGVSGASGDVSKTGNSYSPNSSNGTSEAKAGDQTSADSQDVKIPVVTERMIIAMLHEPIDVSLETALSNFYDRCSDSGKDGISPANCKLMRNRIQDRIIFSSNSACRIYKNNLKQFHATENTAFGSITTLLGGLGAMTTGAAPARILAGGAGISSGLNSQLNENVYSTLAVEVVTKAIDKARDDELRGIAKSRDKNIENYTIERAIADADLYHSKCSLLSGLQEASTSVNKAGSPSAADLNDLLKQLDQSVTLKLGQNVADVFNGQTLFASAACETMNSKFELRLKSVADSDKSKAKNEWKEAYNANCSNTQNLDNEVLTAYKNYSKSTDDLIRQGFANDASILQLRIKSIATTLENKLQTIATQ